mmetsp:Transcript_35304/g.89360  ORF Transcript_35304/g.89360 Transcript_35304/m.89360 type:complete len:93 (-) Transcript_35304:440-718(-)
MAAPTQPSSGLTPEMLKIIRGEIPEEHKEQKFDQSLQRWWKEYASRKNDEEEEHVADSLLYDERCHLPRTTPKPVFKSEQPPQHPPTPPNQD